MRTRLAAGGDSDVLSKESAIAAHPRRVAVDIGPMRRVIEVEPVTLPVPEELPEPEQVPENEPAEPAT